ncbi:glycosyltransferase family 4 protein [Fibrella forsythiae]|uniref:Glycosyltransferase family 4 protein n=1 Tax=Fibrella forsythiae TaxID=2817061 RepID=A0ABS3JIL8_9BACT|nr:glycosyltransferase family 1 protein [Fibrella forsythiae]MBO0949261.1 glycosyltransferase family 4 protein [Fibrella forsythiae]
MRILFDHQAFSQQEYGGISRYFCELITGINRTVDTNAYLSLLFSNNVHLDEVGLKKHHFFSEIDFYKKTDILYKLNKYHTILDLKWTRYDIFHSTNYDPYFIPFLKGKPFVVTFYDAIHERFNGQYKELSNVEQLINDKRLLGEQASAIIAISHATKKDLIELHGFKPDKIHVVHLGSSLGQLTTNQLTTNMSLPDMAIAPYLLYVGKRDAYKNFPTFLRAIESIIKRDELRLICAGGGAFTDEEQLLIRSFNLEARIAYQPINDTKLQSLYTNALAFVFPSLYEGFGIPVLEAFACGCPCVLSNTSSLPEVGGDAAQYFDPKEEDSIAQSVERVISDESLRSSLISKGYQRLSLFSWAQTVERTLSVYESVKG